MNRQLVTAPQSSFRQQNSRQFILPQIIRIFAECWLHLANSWFPKTNSLPAIMNRSAGTECSRSSLSYQGVVPQEQVRFGVNEKHTFSRLLLPNTQFLVISSPADNTDFRRMIISPSRFTITNQLINRSTNFWWIAIRHEMINPRPDSGQHSPENQLLQW